MRLLVAHGWLKGNLGDVLQTSVFIRALRSLNPQILDFAGYPRMPSQNSAEILGLIDRYIPEPFEWYWKYSRGILRQTAISKLRRRKRALLFSDYDAVLSAPGAYLAHYDARCRAAIDDMALAEELGVPWIISSHSIGPLGKEALRQLQRAALCVVREKVSYEYLQQRGVPCMLSADLAFLYPFSEHRSQPRPPLAPEQPYRLLVLRSNNFGLDSLRLEQNRLICGASSVALPSGERLIIATSDARRDSKFLHALSGKLSIPSMFCSTVSELIGLIAGSNGIISDRYHPLICAAALGKTVSIIENREPNKMLGLKRLLEENSIDELQSLARQGLDAISRCLAQPRQTDSARSVSSGTT